MSNVVGRGLGQPGEGSIVAQGLGIGSGGPGTKDLEAICQANGQVTCEIDPGTVVPLPPGGGAETARRLRIIDLEPQLLRAEAQVTIDLQLEADMDGFLVAAPAVTATVDVVSDLDAIVAASANAGADPARIQDEATALAILL